VIPSGEEEGRGNVLRFIGLPPPQEGEEKRSSASDGGGGKRGRPWSLKGRKRGMVVAIHVPKKS